MILPVVNADFSISLCIVTYMLMCCFLLYFCPITELVRYKALTFLFSIPDIIHYLCEIYNTSLGVKAKGSTTEMGGALYPGL